jgi:hypothetical protein
MVVHLLFHALRCSAARDERTEPDGSKTRRESRKTCSAGLIAPISYVGNSQATATKELMHRLDAMSIWLIKVLDKEVLRSKFRWLIVFQNMLAMISRWPGSG